MITKEQYDQFKTDGYVIVRGLFGPEEVKRLQSHFMHVNMAGNYPGADAIDRANSDPLKKYPRIMQPHRWDEVSLGWMLDPRLCAAMTELLGSEPYAVQTMFYFKPPGARGQALHQDQYYLRVQPGTCMAAWLAVDDCDEENGCLMVAPGSHEWPVLCTVDADATQSFTDVTVDLPDGAKVVPAVMQAGDVLFFNGQLVHGSNPNTSLGRYRRSLIGHYLVGEAEKVAKYYHPVFRMDGSPVELGVSEGGDLCGQWVEVDGTPILEIVSVHQAEAAGAHG